MTIYVVCWRRRHRRGPENASRLYRRRCYAERFAAQLRQAGYRPRIRTGEWRETSAARDAAGE